MKGPFMLPSEKLAELGIELPAVAALPLNVSVEVEAEFLIK